VPSTLPQEGGDTAPWGGCYHEREQVNASGHGGSACYLSPDKAQVKGKYRQRGWA